ncbi:MAG: methyltransferase domain-containing protein [Vicinamibacterales bacterium]
MTLYGEAFHRGRHEKTERSARTILNIVKGIVPSIASVVDVGCGVGTWLHVSKEFGATEIQGFEVPGVDTIGLQVPREAVLECDLNKPFTTGRRYDLAIALEVAEHLRQDSARTFVSSITRLSDFVLFSAAIPSQGGVGHLNEQWPPYWIELFAEQGFIGVDVVRKRIWDDESIPFWYRQNILLFVRRDRAEELNIPNLDDAIPGELYLLTFRRAIEPSVRLSLRQLLGAVERRLKVALHSHPAVKSLPSKKSA